MTLAFPKESHARIHSPQRWDVWGRALGGFQIRRLNMTDAKDLPRRQRCENDLEAFKATYFPHWFSDPCEYHVESTARKQAATLLKEPVVFQYAEAAPRSIGKTTDCRAWAIWCILYGHIDYVLFLTVNGPKGQDHITTIKQEFLHNQALADDFPEIAMWVRSFGGDARRCKILYPGQEWNDNELHFPTGAWICASGMDAALPGMNKNGKRPKLIILEDPEDLKIATSASMRKALRDRLYMEALKLHDIHQRAIYWWVCTIYARDCVADEITNAQLHPEWRGRRYQAVIQWPERMDLVQTFADLYRERIHELDKFSFAEAAATCLALKVSDKVFEILTPGHRRALQFYVANKDEIERGMKVLDPIHLPFHRCLEEWAKDPNSFAYQLQNDPPKDENKKTLQLDVEYILSRRVGEDRGIIPVWGVYTTAAIDVGAYVLHWEVNAWDEALKTSCLIDQGQQETNLNAGGEYKMTDSAQIREFMERDAVEKALQKLRDKLLEGYLKAAGGRSFLSIVGVDCGGTVGTFAWYELVLRFCRKLPSWLALKGEEWKRSISDRAIGLNWICERQNNPLLRHDCNADYYKKRVVDAFNAPARTGEGAVYPGARILHAKAPEIYAVQQTSEYWCEEIAAEDVRTGKERKIGWNKRSGVPNHWFDTAWMNFALSEILKSKTRTTQGKKYGIVGKAW